MGLSGDEREFLLRLLNMPDGAGFHVGTKFFPKVHFSTLQADGEKAVKSLISRGYCSASHDPLTAKITEAGAAAIRAEKKSEESFKKGMEGGKKMFGNAVNRLRAKLSDQRVPTCANKLHKLFSKRTDLTEEEKALLAEIKDALKGDPVKTQKPQPIVVNGREMQPEINVLAYSEIAAMAGHHGILGNSLTVAVTMRNDHQGQKAFTMLPGDSLFIEPGWKIVINVVRTDNA